MRFYVEDQHLLEWRESHESQLVSAEESRAFVQVLEQLPWNAVGMRLDWARLGGLVIDLCNPGGRGLHHEGRLGRHRHVFVFYSEDQPGLVGLAEDVIDSLDELYWKAPGVRYICGVDLHDNGSVTIAFEDMAEYDPNGRLTVRI